jgi:two-component system, OmpR family, response regulator
MRVLLVEDRRQTAAFVRKALQSEGFAVDVLEDGDHVVETVGHTPFDVVVLDVMLPGRDGLSVVREMRERRMGVPVLLLTARGSLSERVEGLNAGADDYLPKPFALEELVARVRALSRRASGTAAVVLRVGDLVFDSVKREAERAGVRIDLSPREARLLEHLMRRAGEVCTRMAIVEKVWDYDFDPGTNLVDVYIKRLREKIDVGHLRRLLHTVRGKGYMLREEP